ncbi:septum formation initiator family protein [Candidatus Aminicenantes bacterium AC-335-A11]|jgi:cell division protein FtsB|nr:septum formation initiator family protein [SCandidatus Aminicenantes bacterium Aminicenantia_JdfR_composite]MCP2597319.1 septum formation initiator family protein [Candidatus Aminicenantes bacterium AC-335-G13]MCP2598437.1 septum formation initiator family protein [Candidatus Aminicenantes bacterium AC-335-L06]MCP2605698.1 septum formation initiator family protein [Candidatus Aminicenantes bacterium AC-335-O07]MCP2618723.1 septum formation initiator family protein [Candidatus Aminicenantes b
MKAKKKSSFKNKFFVTLIGFFILIFIVTSFFGEKGLIEIYKLRREYKNLQREIELLKREKKLLEDEIKELEKNPRAVEKEARMKLWLIKPYEVVIVLK